MAAISRWLERHGLGQYADAFEENDIDVEVLADLTDQDLKDLGLSLGHRRKFLKAIKADAESDEAAAPARPAVAQASPEAERRQLTVMFCDLVGSTALSEKPSPGNCAPPLPSPGCGANRVSGKRPTTCCSRSMTGSRKASTPPI